MSAETVARLIVGVVEGYLVLGLIFAVPFVLFLASRVDPSAKGSTWGFRVLVLPGVTLLWPLMLTRVLKRQERPVECNAHRLAAMPRTVTRTAQDPSW
ncbi:MAG: hypothetical protein OES09_12945 [Gammaproteobacteria bacterium]|nr:hypothetical protein [Gammaproteobacteria bacterium]